MEKTPDSLDPTAAATTPQHDLTSIVVPLLKSVLYRDEDATLWAGLLKLQARVRDYVTWGVGPRAAQALVSGAKARAFLRGRATATFDDVRALAPAVFRHRLVCSYAADADGVSPDDITKALLEHVPYPGRSEARGEPSRVARWWRALMSTSGPKTRSPGE